MSGYETEELGRIEAALDGMDSPTSEDVFQATRPYDERAIASVAAARAGSGGSSAPTDWLRIEQQNGQTFVVNGSGDVAGHVAFDTVAEQSGTNISWDAGSPANIVLQPGWYSLCATVFFIHDAGGVGLHPQGSVGFAFASPWIDEIPVVQLPQPEATRGATAITLVISVPDVRIPAQDTLNLSVGCVDFADDLQLFWVEFAVVRRSALT